MQKHSPKIVAKALQEYLKNTGLSRKQFARDIGKNENMVGRWVAGKYSTLTEKSLEALLPILAQTSYDRNTTYREANGYRLQKRVWTCGGASDAEYEWGYAPFGYWRECDEQTYNDKLKGAENAS